VKVEAALQQIGRLSFDTAPVIYYVERHPRYVDVIRAVFDRVRNGLPLAVTSPVTLTECLVAPYRAGRLNLVQDFTDLIVGGRNTLFVPVDAESGRRAAELRARYNLTLPDAVQVAVALTAGCEAMLTNDVDLRRVRELRVILVDELEL
jgi:predicted nucleic acid-binding protein